MPMTKIEQTSNRLDSVSIEVYDSHAEVFAAKWDQHSRTTDIETAFALVDKTQPRVVELGYGSGRDAVDILKRTPHYIGIDASPKLQEIAKAKSPNGQFLLGDFSTAEFDPNSADIVFTFASLIHFDKEGFRQIAEKVHTWLDTNGIFYVSLKRGSYGKRPITDNTGTRFNYFYEIEDIRNLTEDIFDFAGGENQHLDLVDKHRNQDWILVILRRK